ncbi:hypothetical protein F0562_027130 [Nyssa sinensis]|uniref:Uncharacterized protein n=1 Tax=Nyssa sinensis TaxID=561372 RepID=A0A5J5B6P3_9ASTE|nr:hypothetical protein F0562_027130 [Nyssa sinensis]
MDKSRDVRRGGASRFLPAKRQINKQSGLDGGGSGDDGRMVKMSFRPTTGKRFKLPKRFFDDCNTVDHASVPRKLRSAMKKRNHESISPPLPDSKKPSHAINGVQLPKKNGVKKFKLNLQKGDAGGSPRHAIVGTITKDEEEVVETLHALAEMFPTNDKTHKTNLDSELSEAKSPALPEGESSIPSFEDSAVPKKKEDSKTICPSATTEAANPSPDSEGLGQATVEVKYLNELSQLYLPNCKQLHIELDNSVPQVNLPTSLLSESEPTNERPSCNSVSFDVPSELSLETGSKQTKYEETPASERKPEIALEPDAAVRSQHELQYTIKERKKSGSTLWPGAHGAEISGPSLQSSAATVPTTFSATYPGPVENGVSTEKDSLPVL